jgi:hypothetical protein
MNPDCREYSRLSGFPARLAACPWQIDSGSALRQFMQFANRLAGSQAGVDRRPHDLLGPRY